jgi:hypothetical protein
MVELLGAKESGDGRNQVLYVKDDGNAIGVKNPEPLSRGAERIIFRKRGPGSAWQIRSMIRSEQLFALAKNLPNVLPETVIAGTARIAA